MWMIYCADWPKEGTVRLLSTSTAASCGQGNVTLFIGVQETLAADGATNDRRQLPDKSIIRESAMPMVEPGEFFVSHPVETFEGGGAVCFVLKIERYERIARPHPRLLRLAAA